jgi:SAM-dependent methyltransferase
MGLVQTLHRVRSEFFPSRDAFDRNYHVDTSGIVSKFRLRTPSPNRIYGQRYQPVDVEIFSALMRDIPEDFSRFTFIDLGCGKGRALLLAGKLGFSRIIGVEYSQDLVDAAKKNCPRCSIICADATQFPVPGGPTVLFMYNPFGPVVLSAVLQKLTKHKGPLYIAYVTPNHDNLISESRMFNLVARSGCSSLWLLNRP